MITDSKVTEIFCIADDFCKEFEVEMAKRRSQKIAADADGTHIRGYLSDLCRNGAGSIACVPF